MVIEQNLRERAILDLLKERYEGEGYSFFVYPSPSLVPAFLDDYRPDAIARRPDGGVVIEVKAGHGTDGKPLPEIAGRFRGRDDWKFVVVYSDDVNAGVSSVEVASRAQVDRRILEVERLVREGHSDAAFLLAWSALEAVARAIERPDSILAKVPKSARQVVEYLEREGLVPFETGRDLRRLANTRNALVHGDLSAAVSGAEVATLVGVLRSLLDVRDWG